MMNTIRKNLLQFVFIVCVIFMPKMVYAADNISGEWEYKVSSSEATLTKYDGNSLHIEIPSMIDGYPVTGIGGGIFDGSNITKSSNKKVATVTANGLVKARRKGKAVITAKAGEKTLKCKVTII